MYMYHITCTCTTSPRLWRGLLWRGLLMYGGTISTVNKVQWPYMHIWIHTRVFLQTYATLIHPLFNHHALSQPFRHACVCLSMSMCLMPDDAQRAKCCTNVALIVCLLVSKLYLHAICYRMRTPLNSLFTVRSPSSCSQWACNSQIYMFVGRLATVWHAKLYFIADVHVHT